MDYPIWDLAMGGGMLMALVAIPHVIVSHFAIGGGLLIVVTETLSVKREEMMLARTSNPVEKPGLVTGTLAAMTLTIAVMSITRDQVRALYLEPSTAQFSFQIVPQWGNFVLFALLLAAGFVMVGYMRRVLTSPASGADAA